MVIAPSCQFSHFFGLCSSDSANCEMAGGSKSSSKSKKPPSAAAGVAPTETPSAMDDSSSAASGSTEVAIGIHQKTSKDDQRTPDKQNGVEKTVPTPSPSRKLLTFNYFGPEKKARVDIPAVQIAELTPQLQSPKIEFRVTFKGPLKDTPKCLAFNFFAYDGTDEISCTAFAETAEKYFEQIEVNGIYSLSSFVLEEARTEYKGTSTSKYEVKIKKGTKLTPLTVSMPEIPFKFRTIEQLEDPAICKLQQSVDVIGIVVAVSDLEELRDGKVKRVFAMIDDSQRTISAQLWDQYARDFNIELFSVVAIRNAQLKDFEDVRYLSCGYHSTLIWESPNITQANSLRGWFTALNDGKGTSTD